MGLRYETVNRIAYFTLDRPDAHNAIDSEMLVEFEKRILEFNEDDQVWVAIITGAGSEAFCAGADLKKYVPKLTGGEVSSQPTRRIYTFKGAEVWKPVIAAVNGLCVAGGTEILLGTDIRVAAEHATFGLPEVRWSLTARGGATVRIPRQIPWAPAMEMLLTGARISAQRAYDIGLINKVVPADAVINEAEAYAEQICANGPLAVRAIKESVTRTSGLPLSFAYELDYRISEPVFSSADAKEGPRAFAERRTPDYTAK
jgi:enoyl-CoA hydratase